jgi:hypothetical protein
VPIPSSATAFGDSDLPTLLADMSIAITVGGVSGVGLLDEADEVLVQDADRGEVVVLMTTLTVRTSDFPNAAIDQAVTIGASNFTVRERQRIGDGALTKLLLSLSSGGGSTVTQFADSEVPTGAINGTNRTFTLANAPNPSKSLELFLNGEVLAQGGDYTLSGNTITLTGAAAPSGSDQLLAWYRY